MTLQIRPVCSTDYHWLLKLHHTVYRDLITEEFGGWDEDEELGLFHEAWDTKPIRIIMRNDRPVGMFIVIRQDQHLWLDEIQIEPEFQNQGIGSEILRQLIRDAHHQHLSLRLRVLHANHHAFRLYQALGFRPIEYAKHHQVMEIK